MSKYLIPRPIKVEGDMSAKYWFNENVRSAITKHINKIRGVENREDATQEAYLAIVENGPMSEEEAILVAVRAVEKCRSKYRRESKRDSEGWVSNSDRIEHVDSEWMHFAVHYLGIDNDEYDNTEDMDSFADIRSYDTADFPIRKRAFR